MYHLKALILVIILYSLFPSCSKNDTRPSVDFNTPINTIRTFYEYYNNKNVIENCFQPKGEWGGSLNKTWLQYKINEPIKTKKSGEMLYNGISIDPNAVEITVDVKMNDSKKGNPTAKFWYLLQKFGNNWKIIAHSYIPDEYYPAMD